MLSRLVLPVLALAAAAPAIAEPVSIAVPHADLDLTREAGRKVLDARVTRAAQKICGTPAPRELARFARWNACVAEVRASARPQVELAYEAANARRVASLATKVAVMTGF